MKRILVRKVLLIAVLAVCGLPAVAASVSGRAVQKDGSSPSGPCRTFLQAELDRRGAPEPDLDKSPDGKTSFSAFLKRGYFQIGGVAPGMYMLAIECPAASAVRELRVQSEHETRVYPQVLLEDLTFAVAVTPGVDPEGQPWQLTVDATVPRLRRIADKVTTSSDGRWVRRGLASGNYRVTISSSDGTPWLQRFFNLSAESGPLSVRLPFMRVEGQVRIGLQPVCARLVFHNDAGGEPMTLISDNGGFFQGLLPATPGAQETKWTVEARGLQPPVSRRLSGVSAQSRGETNAWLDLALPAFAVHGTVVSEKGKAQKGVQVTFEDSSRGTRTSTASDDAGAFELADLPPGKYTAVAESLDGVSEHTALQVVQGVESELKLVLKPSESIVFQVVSGRGPVSDAAVQVWISPGVPRYFTRTDPDGRFAVKVPPGTTEVGLTVGSPGYAVKLVRLPISSESDTTPDATTITLDESGGTLMLDLHPGGQALDSSATPYLVHDRAIEAVGTLAGWGSDQADASAEGPMMVKAIEPGAYALCLVSDPAQLAILWWGTPPTDRCRTGSVEQGGTLTLSPP